MTVLIGVLTLGIGSALAFSFGSDDDDDWWRYSYYGNPNQPWVAPNGMMFYPRLPYFERQEMVDRRHYQMNRRFNAMNELGDMLYGKGGFDRTEAIKIARLIEATSGHALTRDFHPGSIATYDSRTTLALWSSQDVFLANAQALQAAAKALAEELAKKPTEKEGAVMLPKRSNQYGKPSTEKVAVSPAVWEKFNEVQNVCDHCHRSYRGFRRW